MTEYLPVFSAWVLIAIGLILIALEVITMTFVILYFGIALILTGALTLSGIFAAGEYQLLSISVLALLLFIWNNRKKEAFMNREKLEIDSFKTGDIGIVILSNDKYRVQYKGTSWPIENMPSELNAGDKVIVEELKENKAYVRLLQADTYLRFH